MKLIYEINRYGYWQEAGSRVVYYTLESLQDDIYRNYHTRKMLVLKEDSEHNPIKVQFETEENNATKF